MMSKPLHKASGRECIAGIQREAWVQIWKILAVLRLMLAQWVLLPFPMKTLLIICHLTHRKLSITTRMISQAESYQIRFTATLTTIKFRHPRINKILLKEPSHTPIRYQLRFNRNMQHPSSQPINEDMPKALLEKKIRIIWISKIKWHCRNLSLNTRIKTFHTWIKTIQATTTYHCEVIHKKDAILISADTDQISLTS